MDSDLKRIIDTNYPEFEQNTVDDALVIVGKIVQEVSNPAVYQHKFNQMVQNRDEPIREFVTRLRVCSLDCDFVCPYDDQHDLTDYYLINRIRTAVHDSTLQQEILQKHETLNTVEALLHYCENYESTKRDRELLKQRTSELQVGVVKTDHDLDEEEVLAAISAYKKKETIWWYRVAEKLSQLWIPTSREKMPCIREVMFKV